MKRHRAAATPPTLAARRWRSRTTTRWRTGSS